MKYQKGFTLIELIVVIVILGILAATALPKFTSLQRDARIAKLNAARGAVQAASGIIRSTYLVRAGVTDTNLCPTVAATNLVAGTVCTEAGLVTLANGYPAALGAANAAAGILSAAGIGSSFIPTSSTAQLNADGFGLTGAGPLVISVTGGPTTVGAVGALNNPTCSFSYTAATALVGPVVGPVIITGC